jgi:perosamine synthetase
MNLPDILAALGLAQLKKCDEFLTRRRQIAAYYRERFARFEELELPPSQLETMQHSWHLFILRLKPELLAISRDEFINQLKALGIGTSVHFIPLHLHPFYVREYGYRAQDLPCAKASYSRSISLPIYPSLGEEQCERVVEAVTQIVERNSKKVVATSNLNVVTSAVASDLPTQF